MHRNFFFLGLLTLIFFSSIWFGTQAVYEIYKYYSLNALAKPTHVEWKVIKKGSDHYELAASYTFLTGKGEIAGETALKNERFLNTWGAEQRIQSLKKEDLKVYYSSKKPAISTLFKRYPYRQVFYGCIMVGLSLYFIGLGYYVGRYQTR